MGTERKSFLIRYGAAILAVAAGFFLRSILSPLLGDDVPFITFFPAVAVAALIGGFGAGVFATFLSAFFANLFIMPPTLTVFLSQSKDLTNLLVFLAMGSFISWAVGERGRIQEKLHKLETESERALRESEERSLMAQKSTGVGIWEWDLKAGEIRWSEGIYNLLGLKTRRDKESFTTWLDFIFPEDRERAKSKMENLIADGASEFYDEFRITRTDGAIRWIAVQGEIIRNENNEATYLRGVNYDITERKESELEIKHLNHELNRRNKELQAIFDIAPVGIAVASNASCDFISANPTLAAMIGIKTDNVSVNPANAANVSYKHLKNGREIPAEQLPMQRAVAEKRPVLGEEIELLRDDGQSITTYCYAAPVFGEDGNVVSCIAAQIDVTERKKFERELERQFSVEQSLRKEAEQSNRLKDEFLATVSHELRTPLNAILGWVSILRRNDFLSDQNKDKAAEAIERSAKSQSQLIEDLLDVSRIISGKLQLNVKPVELSSIIGNAIETLRPAAEAKGIVISTKTASNAGLVSGDYDRLQQIVWNLLSNAIKFTDKNGKVEIILDGDESNAEIIVSDTGKGIEAEFLPFVFDRFRQADGSITRQFTGLGLGLSIVKHLTELHGGTVAVKSGGEGKGSTFSVSLPLIALPEIKESGNEKSISADGNGFQKEYPKLNDLKILIVDDEKDTLEILSVVFENCLSKIRTASNAAEAFDLVKSWQPHIIVSDIGMPGEDGYSFIKKVRSWESESAINEQLIKAVALTAYAHSDDRRKALDAGFQMHIAKPVEPVELASLIECLVNETND